MTLLDTFLLKEPSQKPAARHVPWWWAFASDPRYQSTLSKGQKMLLKQSHPASSARNTQPPKVVTKCPVIDHSQGYILQTKRKTNGLAVRKGQPGGSKASMVVHISGLASEKAAHDQDQHFSYDIAKFQLETAEGRVGDAQNHYCHMHDQAEKQLKCCHGHALIQNHSTPIYEHDRGGIEIQLNNTKLVFEAPFNQHRVSEGLSTPRRRHMRLHSSNYGLADQDEPIAIKEAVLSYNKSAQTVPCGACQCLRENESKMVRCGTPTHNQSCRHAPAEYYPIQSGPFTHEGVRANSGSSTASYHTCPQTPRLPPHGTTQPEYRHRGGRLQPDYTAPFRPLRSDLHNHAGSKSQQYRSQSQISPVQVQRCINSNPCTKRCPHHEQDVSQYNAFCHTHNRDRGLDQAHDEIYGIQSNIDPEGLVSTQQNQSAQLYPDMKNCRNRRIAEHPHSVNPSLSSSPELWYRDVDPHSNMSRERNNQPHHVYEARGQHDSRHSMPLSLLPNHRLVDHERLSSPYVSPYQVGGACLSTTTHVRSPSYVRIRKEG